MTKLNAQRYVISCSAISLLALSACTSNSGSPTTQANGTGSEPSSSGTKTVSLSVMTSDRFLELAKQKFEETHPNIKIDIKEYVAAPPAPQAAGGQTMTLINRPDPKNTEKYVSSVGAELMSGKASDLIVMNGLPYKKYADKKLLDNIGETMSKDASFPINNYYTGMFDAMKYNGALYVVPIKVSLNMWLGNESVLGGKVNSGAWTWADFKKQASGWITDHNKDGKPDTYPLGRIESDQLISMMVTSSFSKFADLGSKKAKFDSPEFIALLKLAKSMYDDNIIVPDNADKDNVILQPKSNILTYMDMYTMPKMFFDAKGAYYDLPSDTDAKGTAFTSSMPLAINSKSANKKEAWEFVKYLLSDEMQSTRELTGIAVNKNGAKAQEDSLRKLGTEGGAGKMRLNINGKEFSPQPATDQDIAAIEKVLGNVKVYAESDPKITSIVAAESTPFFQGQKSAEEVAKVIQNKVSTYLQE